MISADISSEVLNRLVEIESRQMTIMHRIDFIFGAVVAFIVIMAFFSLVASLRNMFRKPEAPEQSTRYVSLSMSQFIELLKMATKNVD